MQLQGVTGTVCSDSAAVTVVKERVEQVYLLSGCKGKGCTLLRLEERLAGTATVAWLQTIEGSEGLNLPHPKNTFSELLSSRSHGTPGASKHAERAYQEKGRGGLPSPSQAFERLKSRVQLQKQ